MSLQVWLPLNGNLNNQGLSDITFTNQGTIVANASGKIGSCYSRDVKQTTGRVISNSKTLFDSSISICCWAYVADCVGDTANGLVTLHSHKDNANVGITVKQYSSTDYRISCNTGTGSGRTYCTYYGTTNIKNTWSHLSLTYDKVSKVLKLYVNGSCEYTLNNYTNYVISDNIILFDWSTTFDNSEYRPACKLNDVRIYDHCLSAKEVKEISKGLICHYKLDNNGFGNSNLLITQSSPEFSRQGNKYTSTVADTRTNNPLQLQYFTGSTYVSTFFGKDVSTTPCDIKTTFTVPENITGVRIKFNGKSEDIDLFNPSQAPVASGETYTFSVRVLSSKSETVGGVQVENPKLEKGSVVTPWCPHTSDSLYTSLGLDSITESDCSGYNNDGVREGSVLLSESGGRYSMSTYCNSTNVETSTPVGAAFVRYRLVSPIKDATALTVNWWGNIESYRYQSSGILSLSNDSSCPTDYGTSALAQYDSRFRFNLTDGNGSSIDSEVLIETGNWHMYTLVFNNGTVQGYRDGTLVTSRSESGILAQFTYVYLGINGAGGAIRKTKSKWSDFRIYATALSATDIKELYSTSVSIDKDGNMYAYEFKEE